MDPSRTADLATAIAGSNPFIGLSPPLW